MGKTHLSRRELLKQDEFLVSVTGTWDYILGHAREILIGIGVVVAVVAAGWGIFWYIENRQVVSNEDISKAIQLYNAPLITEKLVTPRASTERVFATSQEKYGTAEKEFARLSRKYSGLTGETATYYDALCKFQLGDANGAIQQLEGLTKQSSHGEIGSLAKLSLAEIYASQKNTAQVTVVLQDLINHPSITVPKVTAMMALANYYQQINNKEAALQLYKKIQTEFPSYQIQSDVSTHLAELGSKS